MFLGIDDISSMINSANSKATVICVRTFGISLFTTFKFRILDSRAGGEWFFC